MKNLNNILIIVVVSVWALTMTTCSLKNKSAKVPPTDDGEANFANSLIGQWDMQLQMHGEGGLYLQDFQRVVIGKSENDSLAFSLPCSCFMASSKQGNIGPEKTQQTLSFSLKPDPTSDVYRYQVSVKNDVGFASDYIHLTFLEGEGFSGQGMATIGNEKGKLQARIKPYKYAKPGDVEIDWDFDGEGCNGGIMNNFHILTENGAKLFKNMRKNGELVLGCIRIRAHRVL